ncbi:MAG: transposase, partial [Archangium sp.]
LAALVGLAPYNNDSGQHRGERHCWGGRSRVRAALYLSTMAAIRFNPTIKAKYVELRARDKKPKVAIIACARKLLGILNAMLHANQPWHPPVSATA